jgi:hypothetical protein
MASDGTQGDTLLEAQTAGELPAAAEPNGARDGLGRFAAGNPGGPGRPRRATERAYLATLSDAISLEDWRAIVGRAVSDAKDGDPKAREWIANYVLGPQPMTLLELAAAEELEVTEAHAIRAEAEYHRQGNLLRGVSGAAYATPLERAHDVKAADDTTAEREAERVERARRKAERPARKTPGADGQ